MGPVPGAIISGERKPMGQMTSIPAPRPARALTPGDLAGDLIRPGHRLFGIVWVNRERLSGAPCFAATRVPVQSLFDHLEAGDGLETFLDDFPGVTRDQAITVLEVCRSRFLEELVGGESPTRSLPAAPLPISPRVIRVVVGIGLVLVGASSCSINRKIRLPDILAVPLTVETYKGGEPMKLASLAPHAPTAKLFDSVLQSPARDWSISIVDFAPGILVRTEASAVTLNFQRGRVILNASDENGRPTQWISRLDDAEYTAVKDAVERLPPEHGRME